MKCGANNHCVAWRGMQYRTKIIASHRLLHHRRAATWPKRAKYFMRGHHGWQHAAASSSLKLEISMSSS
jgi:hypothetical protein